MRSLRRSASPYDTFVDSLRPFLAKRLTECGGLILFTGAVALTVALATWSIADPSLNHATDQRAHNVLGRPGAVVADLAMQLLGLGSIVLALPPVLWGVRLMRERDLPHGGLRIALWCVGVLSASAVASALPPTARWPLPTGMGGVAGDALLAGTRMLIGPLAAFAGFVFAAIAILSLTAACRVAKPVFEEEDESPYAAVRAPVRSGGGSGRAAERHDADEPSLGILSLGAVAQAVMRGRASLRDRVESWKAPAEEADGVAYAGNSPALAARRAFADAEEAPWTPQARERAVPTRREPVFDEAPDEEIGRAHV